MADATYKVQVDTSQAQSSLRSLSAAISGLAFGYAAKTAVDFSDGVISLRNKLLQLNPSLTEAQKQIDAIAQIANSSRTSLEATGDLYFRIARSADDLGISQRDAAYVTDTLSKAMAATGISAAEAAGPLMQIGQALQSGRFAGDELKSVLEGMPVVSQAMAKSLGVSVGQLRELGKQGKLTADIFIKAMMGNKEAIDQGFGRTTATVAQQFQVLKNKLQLAAAEFISTSGAGEAITTTFNGLTKALKFLTENIDAVIFVVKGLIGLFLAYLALNIVTSVYAAGVAFVALASRIAGATISLAAFKTALVTTGIGALAVVAGTVFGTIAVDAITAATAIETVVAPATAAGNALDKLSNEKGPGLTWAQKTPEAIARLRELAAEMGNLTKAYQIDNELSLQKLKTDTQLLSLGENQAAVFKARADAEIEYTKNKADLQEKINKINADSSKTDEEKALTIATINNVIAEQTRIYKEHLPVLEETVLANVRAADAARAVAFGLETQIDNAKQIRDIQNEMASITMNSIEKKYHDIDVAARESAESQIAEYMKLKKVTREQVDPSVVDEYYKRATAGVEKLKGITQEHYELSRTWETGWDTAFKKYEENATNAAMAAERVFSTSVRGMEELLFDFLTKGELNWKTFVQSIVNELLKAEIAKVVAQVFSGIGSIFGGSSGGGDSGGGGFFGGILSGIGNAIGGLFGGLFAKGGYLPAGKIGIAGEAGPELISGPANITPMTGATSITYNINAVDARSFQQLLASDPGILYAITERGRMQMTGAR